MRLTMAIFLATAVACSTGALAQPGPGMHPRPDGGMGHGEMMRKLNLTDKQKSDMTRLRTELMKSMVGIQSKIKIARIDLGTLVGADQPDRAAVEGKIKEISDLQYQAKKLIVDHLFDAYALLTPEQQKTFKGMMMSRLSGGGMGHGMWGRGMRMGRGMGMGPGMEMGQDDGMWMGPDQKPGEEGK